MTSLLAPVFVPSSLWDEPSRPVIPPQSLCVPVPGVVPPPLLSVPSRPTSCCTCDFTDAKIPAAEQLRENARLVCGLTAEKALKHYQVEPDDPRVEQLRNFLLALGDEQVRFHFVPLMRDEVRRLHIHDFCCRKSFPLRLFGQNPRVAIDCDIQQDDDLANLLSASGIRFPEWPKATLKPFSTTGSSKRLHQAMAKLDLCNSLGYEIYIAPNELVFGIRAQRTVRRISVIVLEFDHSSLGQQVELLKQLKGLAVAAVFSGGKSLHIFIRLTSPIWNPFRPKSFHEVCHLRQLDELQGGVDIPDYDHIVKCLKYELHDAGMPVDRVVLSNFAGVARVPGFIHHLHNHWSELFHLNPGARWNPQLAQHPEDWSPFLGGLPPFEVHSLFNGNWGLKPIGASVPVEIPGAVGDSLDSNRHPVTTMLHQQLPEEGLTCPDSQRPILQTIPAIEPAAGLSAFPVPTVVQQPSPSNPVSVVRLAPPFLDDLGLYEQLKRDGIPGRGQRRQLHRVLFTAARIHGWFDDERRIRLEWEAILGIAPARIGCSVHEGVQDILGDHRAIKREPYRIWLPDCSRLPDLDGDRRECFLRGLEKLGCPKKIRTSTAHVIASVLWPVVRKAPVPCVEGKAAVQSRRIGSAAGNRAGAVRRWLGDTNILRVRNRDYVPGVQSMLYFINIPLLVWLTGFQAEDLSWTRTT